MATSKMQHYAYQQINREMLSIAHLQNILTKDDYQNIADLSWPDWNDLNKMDFVPIEIEERINHMLAEAEKSQQDSKTFCALAFHGREYRFYKGFSKEVSDMGFSGLVCANATHKQIKEIQKGMLASQRPKECQRRCWSIEDKGIESLRQVHNKTLDYLLNRSIPDLYQECLTQTNYPTYIYKIEISNLCNGLCATCSGKYSTAWQQLEKKHNRYTINHTQFEVTGDHLTLKDQPINHAELFPVDYKNARMINFFGGEPTLEKTNFKILENLILAKNTNCIISFTTHGNFNLSKYQLEIIKQFPNVQFNFSIDAIESRFEYVRYPFKWDKLLSNIAWCRENNIEISSNITLSNLNIFYFNELTDWLAKEKINYSLSLASNHKLTTNRNAYSVTALPLKLKSLIIEKSQDDRVTQLLSSHSKEDDDNYQLFLQDIITQDTWKNINIGNYLPDFFECIKDDLIKLSK